MFVNPNINVYTVNIYVCVEAHSSCMYIASVIVMAIIVIRKWYNILPII